MGEAAWGGSTRGAARRDKQGRGGGAGADPSRARIHSLRMPMFLPASARRQGLAACVCGLGPCGDASACACNVCWTIGRGRPRRPPAPWRAQTPAQSQCLTRFTARLKPKAVTPGAAYRIFSSPRRPSPGRAARGAVRCTRSTKTHLGPPTRGRNQPKDSHSQRPEGWRGECTDPTRGTNTRARGRSHELRAPHTSCARWLLGRHGGLFERPERGRRRPGGSSSQPRRDPAPARRGCCASGRHLGRCSSRAPSRMVRPQSAATGRGPSVLWG